MITITPLPTRKPPSRKRQAGFTLVELMLSTALSALILTAVLSTFLFLTRSGATMTNYNDMEGQSRRALETFAEDVRQASSITWSTTSNTTFTITVNATPIVYSFDSATGIFSRQDPGRTVALITGIAPATFSFRAFNIAGTELSLASQTDRASASIGTKQLQISLEAFRAGSVISTATNKVLSARFILRNKPVTA